MQSKNLSPFVLLVTGIMFLLNCSEPAPADEVAEVPIEVSSPKPEPGDMVLIPPGEFMMGTDKVPKGSPGLETPAHKVTMENPYYIDAYEVTNIEFIRFQTESDYKAEGNWRPLYSIGKENVPVANVTLGDAEAFCEWAGKRLPTEAEWERAARGPENYPYPWGETYDPSKSNTSEMSYNSLTEVGRFETDKSTYGVYDMMGNVQEWTSNRLKSYPKSKARRNDAFNPRFKLQALKGSSYAFKGSSMNLMTRSGYPAKAQYGTGFRCAKSAEEELGQGEHNQAE